MEKYSAFRGSSLHKSLQELANSSCSNSNAVHRIIWWWETGSRRDAVSLSVVGVTFENTDENCWFSACALVTGLFIPCRCHQVGWVSPSCPASCA